MRDEVLHLLDGAVYTSEVPWTKPSPEAFLAAMRAVGVDRAEVRENGRHVVFEGRVHSVFTQSDAPASPEPTKTSTQ